ncbi:hypothetical protein GCM10009584_24640 [Ornithinimicrobium humiphilum]|uniref:FtsX-like permease family protein n=1 Tax=Ornithinimicrobium humiphilum TaxID=125288 RepID=A0A543KMF0_9MICO|nr:permease [Ornithinimicrobium humiphilum]TQM96246.1 hypothetical protein FB476_1110 [Ornithinimicrobium humiphilum]
MTTLRTLAPLLLRGDDRERLGQLLPVAAFAVVTALTLTVAGGAEFFLHLDEVPGADPTYQGVYTALALFALVILAVPLVSLAGSAVRLSTRRRDTRLSSLRLLGAPRSLLVRLSVLEAGGLAAVGVLLGVVGHLALSPVVGLVPFLGGPIGAAAVVPSFPVALATVLVLVGTAVVASALGLRRVAITPLGVRTRQVPAAASWVRALVAVAVLASGYVLANLAGSLGSLIAAIAVILVVFAMGMAVLGVVGPWVLRVLARSWLRRGGSGPRAVTRLLAARTVLDDPKAVWRQVSGVAMVSFTSVVVGVGLALTDAASASAPAGSDAMLLDDMRTGVLLTIALSFLTLAAAITVHAAAEVFDRKDIYVALERLGTPRAALESTRRAVVLRPLVAVCLVSAAAGGLLVLPLAGMALLLSPLTLAAIVGALVLGLLVVRVAVGTTAPLLRQVLAAPEPVV